MFKTLIALALLLNASACGSTTPVQAASPECSCAALNSDPGELVIVGNPKRFVRGEIAVVVFEEGHYDEGGSNTFTILVQASLPDGVRASVAVERGGKEVSRTSLQTGIEQGIAEAEGSDIFSGAVVIVVRLSGDLPEPLTIRFDESKE